MTTIALINDPLGLRNCSVLEIISIIEEGLPFSKFEIFQEILGLPNNQMARIIALPDSTLARKKKNNERFTSSQSERLVRLARILELSLRLFEGDTDATRRWLKAPRETLGGNTPLQMVATEIGAREVENLIDRLQDGVFS